MPTNRVVAGAPAEDIPPTLELIGKRLGVLEDFPLQGGVEGLRQRIIRAGTNSSHRLPDPKVSAGALKCMRSVNTAVVGVENGSLQAAALAFRHEQGILDQARAHVVRDREANQPAGETVDDRGQVHIRPISNRQIRNVPDVHLIRLLSGEFPAHQIREHRFLLFRHCGGDLAFSGVAA